MDADSDESGEDEDDGDEEEDESVDENERIKMDMRPVDDEEMSVMGENVAPSVVDTVSMAGIEDVINEDEVQKFREEVENLQWPDQVDVPIDQMACERFQRYRGLKSFRFGFVDISLYNSFILEPLIGTRRRICRWIMLEFSSLPTLLVRRSWRSKEYMKISQRNMQEKLLCQELM
jgi:hypothetical protein